MSVVISPLRRPPIPLIAPDVGAYFGAKFSLAAAAALKKSAMNYDEAISHDIFRANSTGVYGFGC